MKKVFPVLVVSLVLFGCSKGDGDQFVGRWKKISGNGPDFTIEKHDDVYVVKQKDTLITGNEVSFPAQLKGGGLDVSYGMGSDHMVIDKTTGHLMLPGEELVKITG